MKLTTKLVLSFSSIIVLMLALFGVYYINTERIDHAVGHMDQQYVPSLVAVQTMESLLYSVRSDLAALTPHTDKVTIAEYRDRIKRGLKQFAHHAEAYEALIKARKNDGEPVDAELWANIVTQLNADEKTREEIIRLASEGDTDESIALFTRSRADFIRLARYFDQLVQHDVERSQAAAAEAQDVARNSRIVGAALALVGILFSIAVTVGITLAIKRQLGKDPAQLQLIAGRVAGRGALCVKSAGTAGMCPSLQNPEGRVTRGVFPRDNPQEMPVSTSYNHPSKRAVRARPLGRLERAV